MFILICYWLAIKWFAILFRKGVKKGSKIWNFAYRCIEFLFFIQFWWVFFVKWIMLSAFDSMSTDFLYLWYGFWDKLDRKWPKSANCQSFYFSFNFTVFRVVYCTGFCPDSLFGSRCAHYKQEPCVSLFARPGNHMSTMFFCLHAKLNIS